MKRSALLLTVLLASTALSQSASAQARNTLSSPSRLNWLPWSDEVFSQTISDAAMRYQTAAPVATRLRVASVLLADYEVGRPPLHLTVVGPKDDPSAKALFQAALQYPSFYKRLEWWDTREGKLPNPDVQYPSVPRAAAYVCTERTCSAPIFKPEEVSGKVARVLGLQESKVASAFLPPTAGTAGR